MLILEGLVGLHRTVQLQLLHHYCVITSLIFFSTASDLLSTIVFSILILYISSLQSSIDLDYHDIE